MNDESIDTGSDKELDNGGRLESLPNRFDEVTIIPELVGLPFVNSKGVLRKNKGVRLTLSAVTYALYRANSEASMEPITFVSVSVSTGCYVTFTGELAYVVYMNRTALRIAGWVVTCG